MSLVFVGLCATFHHQCFKMVDTLIRYHEQKISSLNPHATPYVPESQIKVEIKNDNNRKEIRVANTNNEHENNNKLNNSIVNSSNDDEEWIHQRRIGKRYYNKDKTSLDKTANSTCYDTKKNESCYNKYEILKDDEVDDSWSEWDEGNLDQFRKENDENKDNDDFEESTCHIDAIEMNLFTKIIEDYVAELKTEIKVKETELNELKHDKTSLFNKITETFVQKDNDDEKDESHAELELINHTICKVTNELSCRLHEEWIDIKKKLNIEVISKEGDNLTWYRINGKWYGTILHVNEIIQLYFHNPEKTKLRDENEYVHDNSENDDDISYRYGSVSEDSMDVDDDDDYDYDSVD